MRLKQAVSINPSNYCHYNFINEPSSTMNCFMENGAREVVYESARSFHKEDGSYHCSSSFMEFDGCPRQESRERNFLKHSNNSAFSRYFNLNPPFEGILKIFSVLIFLIFLVNP